MSHFQARYSSLLVHSLSYFLNIFPINAFFGGLNKCQSWFLLLANEEEPAKEKEPEGTLKGPEEN